MNKLGIVKQIYHFSYMEIISVELSINCDYLKFNDSQNLWPLKGYKFWPERNEIDLVFKDIDDIPEIGSSVYYKEVGDLSDAVDNT